DDGRWLRGTANLLSPDGTRLVYWDGDDADEVIKVLDIASGNVTIAYHGGGLYLPVGFTSDAIYLTHAINLRQDAFDKLYRLDPAGGLPQLDPGSDRHMY